MKVPAGFPVRKTPLHLNLSNFLSALMNKQFLLAHKSSSQVNSPTLFSSSIPFTAPMARLHRCTSGLCRFFVGVLLCASGVPHGALQPKNTKSCNKRENPRLNYHLEYLSTKMVSKCALIC